MEMIDEKGYDKKTTWGEDVFVIIFIIVYSVIIVLVCMMDDVSLIMKLLCVTFMLWYIYTYLGSKTFCLFNYEEFHYYEIDRFRKKITIHIYAKWKDIKYIECDGGSAFSNPTLIKFKNSTKIQSYNYTLLYQFRKDIKKYSKREDIIYKRSAFRKKKKLYEKDW